jgi:hypothetical protein
MEREVRAEMHAGAEALRASEGQVAESIMAKLDVLERRTAPKELAAGWTKTPGGDWVPPGYGWVGLPEGWAPPADWTPGAKPPGDAM